LRTSTRFPYTTLFRSWAVTSDWACRVDTIEGDRCMSELAFTVNGDTFEVPSTVTAWRVRRLKPRGAPELVYARDGRPLTLPIERSEEHTSELQSRENL